MHVDDAREQPTAEEIEAEVRNAVADALEVAPGDVRPDLELDGDLGVDSLGMIQIRVALEESLGVRAPDDLDDPSAQAIRTVGELIALVRAELERAP
jgi:acyl carrier protein